MKTILILLVLCANAMAGELPDLGEPAKDFYGWTKKDIAKEAVFGALMYADYRQTMDIKNFCARRNPGTESAGNVLWVGNCDVHETNPFLGKHPSDVRIRNYFGGTMLAHVVIVHLLPPDWRKKVQDGSIVFQGFVVGRNAYLGLSTNF